MNENYFFRTSLIGFYYECMGILYDLRWMILLAAILILTDLWFGISASKYLKVEIRKSRAGRRTFNKIIDYICYLLIGATIGKAIGEPYGLEPINIAITVLVFCYAFEIDSIYSHICTLHGIDKKFSIWKLLWYIITFKYKELGGAFKEIHTQINTNKNNKKQEE